MNLVTNNELFAQLGEPARMKQIAGYDIFHPELRSELGHVATRTATRLGTAVSMISVLLDSAQVIIGHHGLPDTGDDLPGTPAEWSLCTHTVLSGSPYCVADSTADPLHEDNPVLAMVGLRSYAGVPLTDDSGHVLGAHCVLDPAPRDFTEDDVAVLTEGATEVMRILSRYRST